METPQHINDLYRKYLDNRCSEAELLVLVQYFEQEDNEEVLRGLVRKAFDDDQTDYKNVLAVHAITDRVDFKLQQKLGLLEDAKASSKTNWRLWISVAATLLLIIGLVFYNKRSALFDNRQQQVILANDIAPGKNTATLTLADGKVIPLSDAKTGVVIDASKLSYNDGTAISTSVQDQGKAGSLLNAIATPRGGQYHVVLPDGTKVWLNAASSIKFPSNFTGVKQRRVELTGEAYFEVSKTTGDKPIPFVVVSPHQQVEVLGTHFNINAYADEASSKTTLLEGAVQVSSLNKDKSTAVENHSARLSPGQQASLNDRAIQIKTVNTEAAVAWKNNKFMFEGNNIQGIMRQVSRWYDVDVVFKGDISQEAFAGKISRFKHLSEVLDLIELTGLVHFKVEGRRITVMP
uniref:FecR family protein n=1 Tax=Pedobacter schmidteae TaxID=2201271 RepID=UPI000EB57305|nr:FecR family protein [Pedobacter schmidteae]